MRAGGEVTKCSTMLLRKRYQERSRHIGVEHVKRIPHFHLGLATKIVYVHDAASKVVSLLFLTFIKNTRVFSFDKTHGHQVGIVVGQRLRQTVPRTANDFAQD